MHPLCSRPLMFVAGSVALLLTVPPASASGIRSSGHGHHCHTGFRCYPGAHYGFGSYFGGGFYVGSPFYGFADPPPAWYPPPGYAGAPNYPPPPSAPGLPPPSGREVLPPPGPVPEPLRALIDVNVPADAELFIEGVKMNQSGGTRLFKTPTLRPGENYSYSIRVVWKDNGREVSRTRDLVIRAGDRQSITFINAPDTPAPEVAVAGGRP